MKANLVRVKVEITGNKLEYLPLIFQKRQIAIYKIKKSAKNGVIFTVDLNDLRKIFAICKNMCYNTKIKGYVGLLSPVAYAIKNVGVTVGIVIFIALAILLDGFVFNIDCVGTGAKLKNEITWVAKNYGINVGMPFSKVDFDGLSAEILKSNNGIKFVSVYKKGNSLVIDSVLDSTPSVQPILAVSNVVCERDGVVESVKVLRGTALIKVGDSVKKGDTLIGAYTVIDEKQYSALALGVVTILATETYNFETKIFSQAFLNASIQKAKFLTDGEAVLCKTNTTPYGYEVVLTVRYTYYGG